MMSDQDNISNELISLRNAKAESKRQEYLDGGGWEKIDGWLYLKALRITDFIDQCQDHSGVKGNIGEIGLYFGKYFIFLYLLARNKESVIGLDLFENTAWRDNFNNNLDDWRYPENEPVIVRTNSLHVAASDLLGWAGGPFRLFSVDGGHSMKVALHDLELANAVLANGGVVMLDDYFDPKFPGVSEALNRFFLQQGEECRLVPFFITGNKLFLSTAGYNDLYRDAIHSAIDSNVEELWSTEFLGSTVTTLI